MRVPKLIWDDGSPRCLPRWAREEIAVLRLDNDRLRSAYVEFRIRGAQSIDERNRIMLEDLQSPPPPPTRWEYDEMDRLNHQDHPDDL